MDGNIGVDLRIDGIKINKDEGIILFDFEIGNKKIFRDLKF